VQNQRVERKYRYSKRAGALNEAAPVQAPSFPSALGAASAAPAPEPLADETSGLFALADLAQRVQHTRPGIPASAPSPHAQLAGAPDVTRTQMAATPPPALLRRPTSGLDRTTSQGWMSMFYYTVEDGQRVLMKRPDGTMEVLIGPKRVRRKNYRFERMAHYLDCRIYRMSSRRET
jgi:hypothetical protein